ncbi:hypothetical protein VKT23_009965 [Stygiomarasmius scandens]|uniref:Uncharacterized protein n=1 Tax=Marasmiellus scandens TaxID=2682957 RepID=A0ABR1JDA4_9AGAR
MDHLNQAQNNWHQGSAPNQWSGWQNDHGQLASGSSMHIDHSFPNQPSGNFQLQNTRYHMNRAPNDQDSSKQRQETLAQFPNHTIFAIVNAASAELLKCCGNEDYAKLWEENIVLQAENKAMKLCVDSFEKLNVQLLGVAGSQPSTYMADRSTSPDSDKMPLPNFDPKYLVVPANLPNMKFRKQEEWKTYYDGKKSSNQKPHYLGFLQHLDGSYLKDDERRILISDLKEIWNLLFYRGHLPNGITWSYINPMVKECSYGLIIAKHPYLAYGKNLWKVKQLATIQFPYWDRDSRQSGNLACWDDPPNREKRSRSPKVTRSHKKRKVKVNLDSDDETDIFGSTAAAISNTTPVTTPEAATLSLASQTPVEVTSTQATTASSDPALTGVISTLTTTPLSNSATFTQKTTAPADPALTGVTSTQTMTTLSNSATQMTTAPLDPVLTGVNSTGTMTALSNSATQTTTAPLDLVLTGVTSTLTTTALSNSATQTTTAPLDLVLTGVASTLTTTTLSNLATQTTTAPLDPVLTGITSTLTTTALSNSAPTFTQCHEG